MRTTRIGFMHIFVALGVATACGPSIAQTDVERRVNLTTGEANVLRQVMQTDEFLRKLVDAQRGLSTLNTIATRAPGPASLVFRWNAPAFRAWGDANRRLASIGRQTACDLLFGPLLDGTPNASFFEELRSVRRCDE